MAMPIDRVTAGAVVRLTSTPIRRRPRSDQQVQLGARVGRPEETLLRAGIQQANDRFDDEAFPRRAYFGMAFQRSRVGDAKQRVQQPAVPDVDLRRLDLPLADVLVPALQLPHHEGCAQHVEISLDGRMSEAASGWPDDADGGADRRLDLIERAGEHGADSVALIRRQAAQQAVHLRRAAPHAERQMVAPRVVQKPFARDFHSILRAAKAHTPRRHADTEFFKDMPDLAPDIATSRIPLMN